MTEDAAALRQHIALDESRLSDLEAAHKDNSSSSGSGSSGGGSGGNKDDKAAAGHLHNLKNSLSAAVEKLPRCMKKLETHRAELTTAQQRAQQKSRVATAQETFPCPFCREALRAGGEDVGVGLGAGEGFRRMLDAALERERRATVEDEGTGASSSGSNGGSGGVSGSSSGSSSSSDSSSNSSHGGNNSGSGEGAPATTPVHAGAVAPAVRGLKASLFPSFPQSVFTLPEDLQEYVRRVQQEQQALWCSRIGSKS
jgi:hypothetical protein